jgi:hypothetical protein
MRFFLDSKVKIIASSKYGSKYVGMTGIVDNTSRSDVIGIQIPGCTNPKSEKGIFWFYYDEIEFIESEENNTMLNHNEDFKVAGVHFISGSNQDKEYYYALFDDAKVDDIVVVQTGHHGIALAQISSIGGTDKERVQCSREIISVVDTTAFESRKAQRNALAKLKKEMDKRVSELQETALYELLAEKDPALATMLSEYKALVK